jgi:hypothetical protein
LVKQVNYGPIESKRYFIVNEGADAEKAFIEVPEKWLIDANFQKLNAYVKNLRLLFMLMAIKGIRISGAMCTISFSRSICIRRIR